MTDENDFRIKPGPRKQSSKSAEVSIPKNYRGFYRSLNGSLAETKAATGRRSSVKPAKPRTGRFNARGRGRAALARGIGPKQGWRIHKATGNRYRARRAIVKVRVVKLRNAKPSVSRGHLAYLQREDAGVERVEGLDRAQVGWGEIDAMSVTQSAFRIEMKEAFRQRQEWLVERGHAELSRERDGKNYVTYKRGYVKALEADGFQDATKKIEGLKDKPFVAAQAGRLLEGTVSQKIELTHGAHAIIETQRAFYLVPWQSVHAQTWGNRIRGRVLSGGGIEWDAGRTRGIGR